MEGLVLPQKQDIDVAFGSALHNRSEEASKATQRIQG